MQLPVFVVALLIVPCLGTPIPRPRQENIPDNEPEPAIVKREAKRDLDSQGTIGLNVFTSPLGGVYSGVGSINPYSSSLGTIGTAYGVNQLNSPGLGGGFYGAAAGLNGLGGFGGGYGPLGPASLGGINGLGGLGGAGALGGLGAGGLGGGYPFTGGFGGGYPLGGGLGILGGLYSFREEVDSRAERFRQKLIKTLLEKLNKGHKHSTSGQIGILQGYLTPQYGGLYGGGIGGLGGLGGIGIAQAGFGGLGGGVVG